MKLAFLRRRVAFASPLRISYVHFATRELQRCFIVKLCPPLRKMVSTSRAKMYQAPPPLRLIDRVGQRSYVNYCAEGGRSLGTRLVQGWSPAHMLGPARPRLREVASLATWCYCFMGYVAIRSSDPIARSQLAYARLLIKEAQRHGGLGWLDYDRAFRQQAAADPSLAWNTLNPGLQASTMFKRPPCSTNIQPVRGRSARCVGRWTTLEPSVRWRVYSHQLRLRQQ